jgi:hypothetical protein
MAAPSPTFVTVGRVERLGAYINLRVLAGAGLTVLLLRVVLGLWALPTSAAYPDSLLERQVGLLPADAPFGLWLQRVIVMPWTK